MKGVTWAKRFLIAAAVIAALYAVAHALGLRAYTAILSGTSPPGGDGPAAWALGIGYVLCYFAAVIGAPILILAAGVTWGVGRRMR